MSLPVEAALKRRRYGRLRRRIQSSSDSRVVYRSRLHAYQTTTRVVRLYGGCAMATGMLLFFAANVDYLASVILSAFVLPFFIAFIRRSTRSTTEAPNEEEQSEIDTAEGGKPAGSRKLRKKSYKKKKNRGNNAVTQSSEPTVDKMEGQPKNEETEKHRVRKKYRSKNLVEISASAQNRPVKFYEPLPIFLKLQLSPIDLYNSLLQYVLIPQELEDNGFPIESLTNPGKVTFSKCIRYGGMLENPNQRLCNRCKETFIVSDDGLYESETVCCYHSGKRLSIGGMSGVGAYSCCGSYQEQPGCIKGKSHVSANVAVNETTKFVKTRDKKQSHQADGIYALDCEMCYTIQGLEVTRISLVGTDGLTVYDSYVLPENPVVDYNTVYSGITANDLKDVKTTLADVQAFLLKLLTARTILVGHGLENDLRALHLIHKTIVDTSVVFPHDYGYPYKRSLKGLAAAYLKQSIQQGDCGHDSVEDARTCMELMLWKIDADSHLLSSQHNAIPFNIPPAQHWAVNSFNMSPNFMPCHLSYWVPPCGVTV